SRGCRARLDGIGSGPGDLVRTPTDGRRGDASFALAVVQRPKDHRAVDVAFREPHQHLLPAPRQELAAHPRAGVALGHAQPATVAIIECAGLLEVELHPYPAQLVAVQFLAAFGAG